MKKLVTPAMVLNAAARDIASGRTDAERLVLAFLKAKSKGVRMSWYKRLGVRIGLKVMGANEYRKGIRLLHRLLGSEAVEVDD